MSGNRTYRGEDGLYHYRDTYVRYVCYGSDHLVHWVFDATVWCSAHRWATSPWRPWDAGTVLTCLWCAAARITDE